MREGAPWAVGWGGLYGSLGFCGNEHKIFNYKAQHQCTSYVMGVAELKWGNQHVLASYAQNFGSFANALCWLGYRGRVLRRH